MNEIRVTGRREWRPAAEILEVRPLLSAGLDPSFAGGVSERLYLAGQYLPAVLNEYDLPGGKTLAVIQGNELTTLAAGGVIPEPVLVRLNADGSPDASFGTDGILIARSGTGANYPVDFSISSSALYPDGRLLLFGQAGSFLTGSQKLTAVRLNADGSIDPSFTLGIAISGQPTITPSGKIYVASSVEVGSTNTGMPVVYRLNADGLLDTTFGPAGDGKITINEILEGGATSALLVAQGESLLLAVASTPVSTLFRFLPDGSPDQAFGSGGSIVFDSRYVNSPNPTRTIRPSILKLDAQGRILLAGLATDNLGNEGQISIVRLDASGRGDASFGVSDLVSITFPPRSVILEALGFAPDGKIVVAAAVSDIDNSYLLGLARLNEDGSPDTSIGVDGTTIAPVQFFPNFGSGFGQAQIDEQGRAVLARIGRDDAANAQVVIQRILPVLPVPLPPYPFDPGPAGVTSVAPIIFKRHITGFVVSFRTPMNPSVGQLADYRLVAAGRDGRLGTRDDLRLHPASALYDAAANVVRIRLRHPLARRSSYGLTAYATALTDFVGRHPSTNFVAGFTGKV